MWVVDVCVLFRDGTWGKFTERFSDLQIIEDKSRTLDPDAHAKALAVAHAEKLSDMGLAVVSAHHWENRPCG